MQVAINRLRHTAYVFTNVFNKRKYAVNTFDDRVYVIQRLLRKQHVSIFICFYTERRLRETDLIKLITLRLEYLIVSSNQILQPPPVNFLFEHMGVLPESSLIIINCHMLLR